MSFELEWTLEAAEQYEALRAEADRAGSSRQARGRSKSSRQEGLFKQVHNCLQKLKADPKHPGLHTHEYHAYRHPHDPGGKVFEAYVQNNTPSAWRVFWCYGPRAGCLTILAITPHP